MSILLKSTQQRPSATYNRDRLLLAALQEVPQLLALLETTAEGLYPAEAAARRRDYGANTLPIPRGRRRKRLPHFPLGVSAAQVKLLLRQMASGKVSVVRKGREIFSEIDIRELVPGDILFLATGDLIPADVRVVRSKELFVDQYILTGEEGATAKNASNDGFAPSVSSVTAWRDICLMGTRVKGGMARAVVVSTGEATYLGKILSDR